MVDTVTADPAAFDAVAADYDAEFSYTALGRILRKRVWRHLAQCFSPGQQVLELACGTGEDAVWLANRGVGVTATDGSGEMVQIVREKARRSGLAGKLSAERVALQSLGDEALPLTGQHFDGAFSNFGGLNTIDNWRSLAQGLARLVRSGGRLVLVLMGPVCPWEILWHLAHGRPQKAFRRFAKSAPAKIGNRAIPIYYPSPGRLRHDFRPWFRPIATESLGLWLPPTDLGWLLARRPSLWVAFSGLEAVTAPHAGGVGDHYIMVLERTDGADE